MRTRAASGALTPASASYRVARAFNGAARCTRLRLDRSVLARDLLGAWKTASPLNSSDA
jgi:hypothetical protein